MKLYQQIYDFLNLHPESPYSASNLMDALKLSEKSIDKVNETMIQLVTDKQAISVGTGMIMRYDSRLWIIGKLHLKDGGFGFLEPEKDDLDDFYVPSHCFGTAHHLDRVLAVIRKLPYGRMEADVRKVLERSKRAVIGLYVGGSGGGYVIPDKFPNVKRILVSAGHTNEAKDKQVVEVELYPNQALTETMRGKVVAVLGYPNTLETDRSTLLRMHGFPIAFSQEVIDFVEQIDPHIRSEDDTNREDCTQLITCTIDPIDAKDHDDALSFEPTENGWIAGVHISDVTYFIEQNNLLDKQAKIRGTSVYLPQGVAPMLPERLSGDLCSLRPKEKRRCISVFFELNHTGDIQKCWLRRTWIRSRRKFHYEEVQEIFDEFDRKKGDTNRWRTRIKNGTSNPWEARLVGVRWFARLQRSQRFSKGGIDFESAEVVIELDSKGKPISVKPRLHLESYQVIEEWMLLANRTVTELFRTKTKKKLPFVYRIHEEPDPEKLHEFLVMSTDLGYAWTGGNPLHSIDFQRYVNLLRSKPEAHILMDMAIRSMMRANYSIYNIGHFGLGFDDYTHFTSPIRRYPDQLVHRLLIYHLLNNNHRKRPLFSEDELKKLTKHCSEREQAATVAERDGIRWKQVEFLEKWVGKELDAIVVSIKPRGLYLELTETLTSAFLSVNDLSTEGFWYDPKRHTLRGKNSGMFYRLGDRIRVIIDRIDNRAHKLFVSLSGFVKSSQLGIPNSRQINTDLNLTHSKQGITKKKKHDKKPKTIKKQLSRKKRSKR